MHPSRSAAPSVWRPTTLADFWVGVPHYPEHVSEDFWARDAERIAAAGFNCVRMAEFTWHLLEPRENEFDFDLFTRAIEGLGRHGIKTILCTPTATPPRWLTAAHPEILRVDNDGRPMSHGSRQHADLSSPVFRAHSRRITAKLAEHFRDNPNVVAWQTDNEFYTSGSASFSDSTRREFQLFLEAKYKTIAAVNHAWGGNFWATAYGSFDEVVLPRDRAPVSPSPGHVQDYHRFLAFSVARFQSEQVAILRAANPSWYIFHNLGRTDDVDIRTKFAEDLDFVAFDIYPFLSDESQRNGGSAYAQALHLDICRSHSGNFIIPEQQAGLGSQANFSTLSPEPGEMRRMAYSSVARGADGVMFFRWRPAHYGAEIYWMGLVDHDDVPRRRYTEAKQFAGEITKLADELLGSTVHFEVGIAGADFDNVEAHRAYPMGLPSPHDEAVLVHQYCYRRGISCGFIHPEDDLSRLKVLYVPHWIMWKPEWTERLRRFAEGGGTVVLTARTGSRDEDNHVLSTAAPGAGLSDLAGVSVEEFGRLAAHGAGGLFDVGDRRPAASHRVHFPAEAASRGQKIKLGEIEAEAAHLYELLELSPGTNVLGTWSNRFMAGKPAITSRKVGSGRVLYVGSYLTADLAEHLLSEIFDSAEVEPLAKVPASIELSLRTGPKGDVLFVVNTTADVAELAGLPSGTDLISGKAITASSIRLEGYDCLAVKLAEPMQTLGR